MDAYPVELWRGVFEMIGAAAATLVGLLFVVVTLHFDRITSQPDHNMRVTMQGARFNMYHLLTVMVEAIVFLTPQHPYFAGAELIALNLFGLRLPLIIIARYFNKHITISDRGGFPTVLIATIIFAYLLGAVGGAGIVRHSVWGAYLVVTACTIKLVRSVLTAWMLMFGITHAVVERT